MFIAKTMKCWHFFLIKSYTSDISVITLTKNLSQCFQFFLNFIYFLAPTDLGLSVSCLALSNVETVGMSDLINFYSFLWRQLELSWFSIPLYVLPKCVRMAFSHD